MQGLGGKFGEKLCEDLGIKHMGDLIKFSREELQRRYDERQGQWLYNIARGIDLEAVTPRLVSKSIGCCKNFPGRNAISAITTLNHWLTELAKEITERLEQDEMENSRRPKQMVVSYTQIINSADVSSSRTMNLASLEVERIVADAMDVLKKNTDKFFKSSDCTKLNNPIKFLGFNVGKFESIDGKKGNTIQSMFERKTIENKKTESKDEKPENETENQNGDEKTENEAEPEPTMEDAKKKDEIKKDEEKRSFFLNYQRMRLEKQAEEEAARAAQEKAELENQSDDSDGNDDENTFQNDMLLDELEQTNQPGTSDSPVASTSSKPEYMSTYAEFYNPSVSVPKVECTQCGKQVSAFEIQVHTDEHLAFQLTEEQREEFRSQLKRNTAPATTTSTTPAAKKAKTSSTTSKSKAPSNLPSIQKFLMKPGQDASEAVPSTSGASDIETEKCTECGKNIPITEIFEHMDYHAAKKLQEEFMRSEAIANRTNNNTITKSVSAVKSKKSKKQTATSSNNNNTNAAKDIASFFQNS